MSFIKFSKIKIKQRIRIIRKISYILLIISFVLIGISLLASGKIIDRESYSPTDSLSINSPFIGDIYFNDTDSFETYSQVTIDALLSAQKTIKIAMYSIRNRKIVSILQEKKSNGIIVEIIVPKNKEEQHNLTFLGTNLDVLQVGDSSDINETNDDNRNKELMHNKYIIIDAGEENQQLLFGSSNLTLLQEKYDSSFLLKTLDANIIDVFVKEFNLLKTKKSGLSKLRTGNFNPFSFKGLYSDSFIEIWFGPGFYKNSIKYRIIDEIEKAEKSIKIIVWRINDRDIYSALRKKSEEGVNVQLIVDDYYMWDKISVTNKVNSTLENFEIFSDSYMDILFKKGKTTRDSNLIGKELNTFLHHHVLIVDEKTIITGSNNWSQGGFYYNDESIMVTDNKNIVERYDFEFNYLYDLLYKKSIDIEVSDNILYINNIEDDLISKIIFYTEKSNPNLLGEICFEINSKQYKNRVTIPNECLQKTTRVFVTDDSYNLIGSNYLKKKSL